MTSRLPERGSQEEPTTEELLKSLDVRVEPVRSPLDQFTPEVRDLLISLRVEDVCSMDKADVKQLGFELYVEPEMLETIVLDILDRKRERIASTVVKPFAIVSKKDVLKIAKEVKAKRLEPESLQRQQTANAHDHLIEIGVDEADMERALLSSGRQRRAIRAESFILREPSGMDKFLTRIDKIVEQDGAIGLTELVGRTINYVGRQYETHIKYDTSNYEEGEMAVHLLEESRLGRINSLARTALLETVEIIRLSGYEENGDD